MVQVNLFKYLRTSLVRPRSDLGLKLIATYSKFRLCCKDLLCIQSYFIIEYGVKRTMRYDRYFILSLIRTLDHFILLLEPKGNYTMLIDD